jgi:hypothetical protein
MCEDIYLYFYLNYLSNFSKLLYYIIFSLQNFSNEDKLLIMMQQICLSWLQEFLEILQQ